jgi:hypothetical protein
VSTTQAVPNRNDGNGPYEAVRQLPHSSNGKFAIVEAMVDVAREFVEAARAIGLSGRQGVRITLEPVERPARLRWGETPGLLFLGKEQAPGVSNRADVMRPLTARPPDSTIQVATLFH